MNFVQPSGGDRAFKLQFLFARSVDNSHARAEWSRRVLIDFGVLGRRWSLSAKCGHTGYIERYSQGGWFGASGGTWSHEDRPDRLYISLKKSVTPSLVIYLANLHFL
jgi:hypothetical protein